MNTHTHQRLLDIRFALKRWIAGIAVGSIILARVGEATAASSWKPTLLVNTESFEIIDDTDSAANPELRFGDSVLQRIIYDRSNTRFQFSKSIFVSGSITATGSLKVLGSMSGAALTVDRTIAASGSIVSEQTVSGATLMGFGLRACTGSNKLLWNSSTQKFECAADQTGGGGGGAVFGSGNVVAIGDQRFLKRSGGSMTGGLIITNGNPAATVDNGVLLEIPGIFSGKTIKTTNGASFSGALALETSLTGATIAGFGLRDCDTATTSKLLWDTTTGKFSCGTDQTGGGGSSPPWAGVLHATQGDGNSIYVARSMEALNTVAGPTPTNIGTTVARCVGYRSGYAITVNRLRLLGVGATTNLYKFAVYPRGTGAARLWESGTVTSAANTWLSVSASMPFSLSANTDYWFCVTVVNTGTTAGFRSPPAPINTIQYNADNSPLGARSIGLPVYVQFAVTAGAFPATLPAVAAAAYAGGTTGSVPFAFFDNSST